MATVPLVYFSVFHRALSARCSRALDFPRAPLCLGFLCFATPVIQAACLAVPPLVLVLAGWFGARVGLALETHALFFLGMLSFASVALVFLVTQELLIEVINTLCALL